MWELSFKSRMVPPIVRLGKYPRNPSTANNGLITLARFRGSLVGWGAPHVCIPIFYSLQYISDFTYYFQPNTVRNDHKIKITTELSG